MICQKLKIRLTVKALFLEYPFIAESSKLSFTMLELDNMIYVYDLVYTINRCYAIT